MSIKNTLQEFCHKQSHSQPKYRFISDELNEDNSHTFRSICTVDDLEFTGAGSTKKDSEKDAAQRCYDFLREETKPLPSEIKKYEAPSKPPVIVLIDVENMPQAYTNVVWPKEWLVVTFLTKYTHHYKNLPTLETMSVPQVIDTSNRDAADIYLAFTMGRLSTSFKGEFLIVTSDHYGDTLNHCLNGGNTTTTSLTSLVDIQNKIEFWNSSRMQL